ncbi:GyrI-like domain-containing protein [Pseudarthrobacter sp. J1763]|uniref:GyrI-like domain-containing protein n=1 Tax=Pseudarthrobacter sp. J1763 TaxID=3420445 RepID=UPI003D2E556F
MSEPKYDLKKAYRELYAPKPDSFSVVTVPEFSYLAVEGVGDPNTSAEYAAAVTALFSVAYMVKFASKAAGQNYVVGPLEGLWSAEDPGAFARREKDAWVWTMMIALPEWITQSDVEAGVEKAAAKFDSGTGKAEADVQVVSPSFDGVRMVKFEEGLAVQVLHVGSYDDEGPILERLHQEYMPAHGFEFAGPHHEIYLSDPRRVAPEKLRTVLRQPVRRS